MKVRALIVCVIGATLASAFTPKARLLSKFQQPAADAVLACPTTKEPLSTERKVIGTVVRTCKVSADGVRYPANEVRFPLSLPPVSPWQPSAAAPIAAPIATAAAAAAWFTPPFLCGWCRCTPTCSPPAASLSQV